MPNVNLLQDTEHPEVPKPPKPPVPGQGPLSNPDPEEKSGFGGVWKSIFKRSGKAAETANPMAARPSAPPVGTLGASRQSVRRTKLDDRILNETKQKSAGVIPLPEEDSSMSVNLLTEDLVSTFDPRAKLMQLGLVILGSIAVIAAGWGGLTIYGKTVTTQVKNAQDELLRTKADIGNSKADQASMAATAQKLAAMKALVDHHVRWTKFFNKVEQYTLPTVSYGPTIAADIHGGITFAATTHSYDDVALQYLLLQAALLKGDYISAFSINGANRVTSKTGETVTFTINLTFVPTIFDNTLDSLTPTGNPLTNSPSPTESSAGQVLTNTSVPTNTNTTILPTNTNISNTNNPLTP